MKRKYERWSSVALSGSGDPAIIKDMAKFPPAAVASIFAVMHRYLTGDVTPNEAKAWQDGLFELCKKVRGSWYRVIFAIEGRELVGIVAFQKKSNETPKNAVRLARKRRDDPRVPIDLLEILRDMDPS